MNWGGKMDYEKTKGGFTAESIVKKNADMIKTFSPAEDKKGFGKWRSKCDILTFTIKGGDGQDMTVELIKPKNLHG